MCSAVGEKHRKKHEAEMKLRKTVSSDQDLGSFLLMFIRLQGAKIRSTYITFAHKEKKRLGERVGGLEKEIQAKEKEVERLKGM